MKKFIMLFTMIGMLLTNASSIEIQNTKHLNNMLNQAKVACDTFYDENINSTYLSLLSKQNETIFQEQNYSSLYFKNLDGNFGNNIYNSCTYTAIGMLLSFYDTYWDDSFIPETYDSNIELNSNSDTLPLGISSPGIRYEEGNIVNDLSMEEYLQVIDQYSDMYFQLNLLKLGISYFSYDSQTINFGLDYYQTFKFLEYYLYSYINKSHTEVEVVSNVTRNQEVEEFVIEMIREGNPVLLRMGTANQNNGHSMIAYDYDENSGEIYVHTGWRDEVNNTSLRHISLSDLPYNDFWDATTLIKKEEHSHSNNFVYHDSVNNSYHKCACSYVVPQNISIVSGNYRDTLPKYRWDSLIKEDWFEDENLKFEFSVLDSNRHPIITKYNISSNNYILSSNDWETTLANDGISYYIYIQITSEESPYWDDYQTSKLFSKPKEYNELPVIEPEEYGFADAYPTDTATSTTFISHTASEDFNFETRRYRTGYIHNEFIVMSPIRQNINEAFIEYRFEKAVTRIDVELAHWREYSNEWLSSSTGTAVLQQYIGNQWVTKLDLLSASTALSTNRNNALMYSIFFEQPAYRIRFYSSSFGVNTNDSNRGRICIGTMAFYESEYNMPLSGAELDYNPSIWNETVVHNYILFKKYVKDYSNCYSYAVNAQVNPNTNSLETMQPGQSENMSITSSHFLNPDTLVDVINYDAENLGFIFEPIGKNEACPEGTYKVALVVDNQYFTGDYYSYDYHWYRQNSDGSWSHKPGLGEVTNLDASKNLIMDPESCDRNSGNGLNYNVFVGYYTIRPLNIYFE